MTTDTSLDVKGNQDFNLIRVFSKSSRIWLALSDTVIIITEKCSDVVIQYFSLKC